MFLGVDLGTGSVKALLLDESGDVLGKGSAPCRVESPRRGWAESDPLAWLEATAEAVREAIRNSGRSGSEVRSVGYSGQMHGVVACDSDGEPLRPAILWADTRATGELAAYRELPPEALRRLGNPPAVGMSGPSLIWLRENESEVYSKARYFLQPKDWIRLRMTGEALTEPSDASAILLSDVAQDRWDSEVLDALGLGEEKLPQIAASDSVAGEVNGETASEMSLSEGTIVATGAADTAAAVLGTGLSESGIFQLTVGTGAQIVALCSEFTPDEADRTHLFRTVEGLDSESPFYAMAAMQSAGLSLEWVRMVLGASWDEVYEEAFSVSPGSDGLTFVPHLSGERTPNFAPDARGSWSGLGLDHGRGHLLRAALEGVAFSVCEGFDALVSAIGEPREIHLAGGGAMDVRWREMLAGVLGRELVSLPEAVSANASGRGAAILAARACGADIAPPDSRTGETTSPQDAAAYQEAYLLYCERRGDSA